MKYTTPCKIIPSLLGHITIPLLEVNSLSQQKVTVS